MYWTIAFFIIIIAILLIYKSKELEKKSLKELPYRKNEYFFSKAEKIFFEVLKIALKELEYDIFAKVRLADIICLPKNTNKRIYYWNKIQAKHVDFLICNKINSKPLMIIELDDSSHKQNKRLERDDFLNAIFNKINLPIIHIPVKYSYSPNELKEKILNIISCDCNNIT